MINTTGSDISDSMEKPILESIKRLGHQARNWETTTDFGMGLDILAPSHRRRFVVSQRMVFAVVGLLVLAMVGQAAFIYHELRAQRAMIEQVSSVLAKKMGQLQKR